MPLAEVIDNVLVMDSFTYERCEQPNKPTMKRSSDDDENNLRTYWRCRSRNEQGRKCRAGAITDGPISQGVPIVAKQICRGSGHNHLPPSQLYLSPVQDSTSSLMSPGTTSPALASPSSSVSEDDEVRVPMAEASLPQLDRSTFALVDSVEQQSVSEVTLGAMQANSHVVQPSLIAKKDDLQVESVELEANLTGELELSKDDVTQQNHVQAVETASGDVSELSLMQQQLSSLAEEMLLVAMRGDRAPIPAPESSPAVLQQNDPLPIRIQGLAKKRSYTPEQASISQQNTPLVAPCQQPATSSEPIMTMKSRKRKVSCGGFAKDARRYHRFLIEFLRNPVFLKENIMRALGAVYKSEFSVVAAYVTVLENKEKVLNDLKSLMINPGVEIFSVNGQSSSNLQTNPLMKDILNNGEQFQFSRYPAEEVNPCNGQELVTRSADYVDSCPPPSKRPNTMAYNEMVPPVPAAPLMKDSMRINRFVPFVDLENNCETILDLTNGMKVENNHSLAQKGMLHQNLSHGVTRLFGGLNASGFNYNSAAAISNNQLYNGSSLPDSNNVTYPLNRNPMGNNGVPNDETFAQHIIPRVSPSSCPTTPTTSGVRQRIYCFVQKCDRVAETMAPNHQVPTQDGSVFNMQHHNQMGSYQYSS